MLILNNYFSLTSVSHHHSSNKRVSFENNFQRLLVVLNSIINDNFYLSKPMQRALLINHYTIFKNEMNQTQICSDRLKQLLTDLKNFMLNPVNSPTKNSNLKLDELFFEINRFEILLELTNSIQNIYENSDSENTYIGDRDFEGTQFQMD